MTTTKRGTAIRWTDQTWNPTTGCSKVSPGCANCYAETLSLRFHRSLKPWTPENAAENVELHPERLLKPFGWKEPSRVFVNSMSDLFHELIPEAFIAEVFAVMAATPQHTYQVLTKRPDVMRDVLTRPTFWQAAADALDRLKADPRVGPRIGDGASIVTYRVHPDVPRRWRLPNVWLGTSIENDRHTFRADHLREAPADIRFISAEPLLGPLPSLDLDRLDWIIVGGESGPGFRPMDHAWARDLRDRCLAAGVAFFFKQSSGLRTETGIELDGRRWEEYPT
jgi:protein gp37